MKNHYEILDVNQNSSDTDIKDATQAKINKIKTIFAILSDAEKHKSYDAELSNIPITKKNYYDILAVSLDANPDEIKNNSKIRINEIKTAFNILSNPEQRKQYDLELNSTTESKVIITDNTPNTPYAPPETLNLETGKCSTCNAIIYQKAEICPKCGIRHRRPAGKLTLLLLTLFTGGFGVHRFYLGNYLWGIIYLLFCWTLIPTLLSFIEYIIFLFKSPDKIEESYEAHESAVAVAMTLPILLFFGGILAAISIPTYTNYIDKAKVIEATSLLENAKLIIEEYLQKDGTFPSTNELKSIGVTTSGIYVLSIEANAQKNYLQLTMNKNSDRLNGKTIRVTYEPNSGNWKCNPGSPNGINPKYLPYNCR